METSYSCDCTGCSCAAADSFPDYTVCGFDHVTDYDWTRNSGGTPTWYTGPSSDHTSGSGFYLYIDARSDWPDYTEYYPNVGPFTLASPAFDECVGEVRFYYHMYGSGIGTLEVGCP